MSIDAVVEFYGSQSEMARVLDVTRQAVSLWVSRDKCLPPKQAIIIEELTDGQFNAIELSCGLDGLIITE